MNNETPGRLTPNECHDTIRGIIEKRGDGVDKSDDKAFTDAWVTLASRSGSKGIDYTLINYLFDEHNIAGAMPIYMLALQSGSVESYKKAFISKQATQNKRQALCLALNLFAFELITPTGDDSVDQVARLLSQCITGVKSRLKKDVQCYLVEPISCDRISEGATISIERARTLLTGLGEPLESIAESRRKRSVSDAAGQIIAWLKCQVEEPSGNVTSDNGAPLDEQDGDSQSELLTGKSPKSEVAASSNGAQGENTSGEKERKSRKRSIKQSQSGDSLDEPDGQCMASVVKFLRMYERQHKELCQRLKTVEGEKKEALKRLELLEPKIKRLESENKELGDSRATLSANYGSLKQSHDTLLAESERLRRELAEAEGMIEVLSEGNAHESKTVLSKLSNDLRHDYRKYLDATREPMTAQLGSIVLGQLGTVFKVLGEHGISFE